MFTPRDEFDDWTSVAQSASFFIPTFVSSMFAGYSNWEISGLLMAVAIVGWSLNPVTRLMIRLQPLAFLATIVGMWIILTRLQQMGLSHDIDRSIGKALYMLCAGAGAVIFAKLVARGRRQLRDR